MKQIKLITLKDFDPEDQEKNPFSSIATLGKECFPTAIHDEILNSIIKVYGEQGKFEIVHMVDRGQISLEDGRYILGENAHYYFSRIPCDE